MKFRHLLALVPSMVFFHALPGAHGDDAAPEVRVIERKEAAGVVLVAESAFDLEFTITLQCDLTNATASSPIPLTMDSAGRSSMELVHIQRADPEKAWRYNYTFHWKRGGRRSVTTSGALYSLPFLPGESHRVIQGNLGKFSHFQGSQDEYAVDWEAPPGTVICAARAGMVTGVRQEFSAGGVEPGFKNATNYIVIKHEDGTFAEYLHIQRGGAMVRLGEKVAEGQAIGRSGNTGYTSRPHIHFAVFQTLDGATRLTLPSRYRTQFGVTPKLEEGMSYQNPPR